MFFTAFAETDSCPTRDGGYAEVTFYPPKSFDGGRYPFIIANSSELPLLSIQVKIEARLNNNNYSTVLFDKNVNLNPRVESYQSYEYYFDLQKYNSIREIKITVGGPVCKL